MIINSLTKIPKFDSQVPIQINFFLLNFSEVIDGVPEKEYEMGLFWF